MLRDQSLTVSGLNQLAILKFGIMQVISGYNLTDSSLGGAHHV
ncbi:MAG: hypothetical protein ACKO2V_23415 [Snowella sp.]